MIRWWSLGAGFLLRLQMDLGWLRDRLTSCLAAVLSFGAWGDERKQAEREEGRGKREGERRGRLPLILIFYMKIYN